MSILTVTFTVTLLVSRKASLSPKEFKSHYENKRIPLILNCLNHVKPIEDTRYYLAHNDAAKGDVEVAPPLVPLGDAGTVDYNCLITMEYRDPETFSPFNEAYVASPRRAELEADEARFADYVKFRMIISGDLKTTTT